MIHNIKSFIVGLFVVSFVLGTFFNFNATSAHADSVYIVECETESLGFTFEDGSIEHYAMLPYEVESLCGHLPTIPRSDSDWEAPLWVTPAPAPAVETPTVDYPECEPGEEAWPTPEGYVCGPADPPCDPQDCQLPTLPDDEGVILPNEPEAHQPELAPTGMDESMRNRIVIVAIITGGMLFMGVIIAGWRRG